MSIVLNFTILSDHFIKSRFLENELDSVKSESFTINDIGNENEFLNEFLLTIDNYELKENLNVDYESYSINTKAFSTKTNTSVFPNPAFVGISNQFFNNIQQQKNFVGNVPTKTDEVVIIKSSNTQLSNYEYFENLRIGDIGNFSVKISSVLSLNKSMKIVGIYSPTIVSNNQNHNIYDIVDDFIISNPIASTGSFLTQLNSFNTHINDSISKLHSYQINMGLSKLTLNELNIFINKMDIFSSYLENSKKFDIVKFIPNKFDQRSNQDNDLYSSINSIFPYEIIEIQSNLNNLGFFSLLLVFPIFLVLFLFVDFSISVLESKTKWNFQLLQTRGFGIEHLKNYFLGLITFGLAGSLIISFGLSIIVGIFILNLNFNSLMITIETFIPVFFIGFIIITLFFIYLIRKKVILAYSRNLDTIIQNNQPYWKKKNIDIILTLIGLIGNIFFIILVFNNNALTSLGGNDLIDPLISILFLFFLPFPFLLLIGSLLLLLRITPNILRILSRKLWVNFGNLASYSVISILRKKTLYSKKILIFSILVSFTITFNFVPTVIEDNLLRQSYIQTGADVFFDTNWNVTLENKLLNDPNIVSFDRIANTKINIANVDEPDILIDAKLIHSKYLEVIDTINDEDLVSKIISQNNTLLVSEQFSKLFKVQENDEMKIGNSTFSIIGTYSSIPGVENGRSNIGFIISYNSFLVLNGTNNVYPLFQEGYIAKTIADKNIELNYPDMNIENYLLNYQKSNEYSIIQVIGVYSYVFLLFDLLIFILMSLLTSYFKLNENSKEVIVEKSLGLTSKQSKKIIIYENIVIALFSNILGFILGVTFSGSFISTWLMLFSPSGYLIPNFLIGLNKLLYSLLILNLMFFLLIIISIIIMRKYSTMITLREI